MPNPYIDSWTEYGTRSAKTGKIPEYKISIRLDGSFACSCPAWVNEKGTKTDCKHILRRIMKLMQEGSPYVQGIGAITKHNKVATRKPVPIKYEEPVTTTRAITFEDL